MVIVDGDARGFCLSFFSLVFQLGNRGTVSQASDFDAEIDAEKLRLAMKGAGEECALSFGQIFYSSLQADIVIINTTVLLLHA